MRLHQHGLLPFLRRPWLKPPIHGVPSAHHPFSIIVSPETTHLSIPVGASGNITLDIHTPPSLSPSTPILIYLPPGPLLPSHNHTTDLTPLTLSTPLTVVRINYRLSPQHQYPIPIHDVLAGYDWVVQHLVRGAGAHNAWSVGGNGRVGDVGTNGRVKGVGVCGELLGGGLAAMLGCTEGRVGKAGMVKALVVGEAVVDWTGMFAIDSADGTTRAGAGVTGIEGEKGEGRQDEARSGTKKRTSKPKLKPSSWRAHYNNPLLPGTALFHARDTLFAKPEHYHDPFASPLLFFRTASSDIPSPSPSLLPFPSSSPDHPTDNATLVDFIRPRRAHRRHPPLGSGLVLPRTRVYVGRASVLRDQGVEFAEGIRRSWGVSERARAKVGGGVWEEGGEDGLEGGEGGREDRMEVREMEGCRLWGEEEMCGVGEWVGGVLRGGGGLT